MKNFVCLFVAVGLFAFSSCGDDDTMDAPVYTISINDPTSDDKKVGDMIDLKIVASEASAGTVHHMKVRIYNKADNTEIYNKPDDAHVHAESGSYTYEDQIELAVDAHTDWILEAKVWGHDAGLAEKIETVEFHVHPQ